MNVLSQVWSITAQLIWLHRIVHTGTLFKSEDEIKSYFATVTTTDHLN